MPQLLVFNVDATDPSITETITVDGNAYDLTGTTVTFRMRLVGSETLKVDAAATITAAATGDVRYDWAPGDVDTAGTYLVWWVVDTGGTQQEVMEALVEFRAHVPVVAYMELEELKQTLELTNTNFADLDVQRALRAASRAIDDECDRRFYPDEDATQERVYTAVDSFTVLTDDILTVTELATDRDGDGVYETVIDPDDYVLMPLNADADARPWNTIRVREVSRQWLPCWTAGVQVTGQFGWNAAPEPIIQATGILAARLLKRSREAPLGVVSIGMDVAGRIARTDPDVQALLANYKIGAMVA